MRRVTIVLGVILGIAVLALVAAWAFFDPNNYRGLVQTKLEGRLNRKISLGDMHIGLLPPRFRVQDVTIADDPNFQDQKPFLQTGELDVSVKLLPLLKGTLDINSLSLQRPKVELLKNEKGIWNFSSIGSNSESRSSSNRDFSLNQLTIQDGQVAITDFESKKPRAVYDHIDVTLRDLAPNKPFSVDAAAHLPGSGAQEVRLQGQGGPLVQGDPVATPFHGTLNLNQVGIADLLKFVNGTALGNTDGSLTGVAKINSDAGKLAVSGQMKAENSQIRGTALGYPISAAYDLTDDLSTDVLGVKAALRLGLTPISVSGTVNAKPTPALLDVSLRATDISIAEAARLAAASGIAFAPDTTVQGGVTVNIQARGAANSPVLNGTVSGHDVKVSGRDIPQPVEAKSVNLVFTPSEIRSDNFKVTSGQTAVNAQFALRDYQSKTPIVDATIKAPNAALPGILAIAKAYGVTAVDKINGAGTLNLDMHAAGPVKAITSAEIMSALNGTLNLNLNNLRYSGSDIGHELAAIGNFLQAGKKDEGFTNISRTTGDVVVKNGIAQTNNLQALLDIGNVGLTGTANLITEALDLHVNAVLSKAFSQQVGGTGIGGYMNTALANNEGELVIPAIVTGTFQHPRFEPDLQKVAQMKLKGLVPNFSNPASDVSGLLGSLLGKNQPRQSPTNQTQQQPQDSVQQLLGIFGSKKKQQQAPPK